MEKEIAVQRKCHWCGKKAETKDYREVDGIASLINSCAVCYTKSTKELLKVKYKNHV